MEQTPYSGMISAYLDGELDVVNDEPLFSALATSPELRTEMREHLSIRSAVQSDVEAFTPPVGAAHTIFSSVGLDFPAPTPVQEKRRALGLFWTKFWRPAAAAVLLSVVTGSAVGLWYENKLGDILTAAANQPESRSIVVLQSAPNSDASLSSAPASQQTAPPVVRSTAVQRRSPAEDFPAAMDNPMQTAAVPVTENSPNSNETAHSVVEASPSELQQNPTVASAAVAPPDARNVHSSRFEPVELYPQFWMQVRGSSTMQSSHPLPSSGASVIDNLAVSAAWKLSSTFSIGIEGGRECYPLQYSGILEGAQMNYRQYAPLVFGGFMAQLSMSPLRDMGNISPFLTVSGGGTEIGPYVRGSLGVTYPLSEQLSLMLGGDVSAVFYDFQQQSFQSWKSGLTYGLLFQF